MGKAERIAYLCGGAFVYQGDMVSIPKYDEPWRDDRIVGVVLGLTSIVRSEPWDMLRIMTENGVYCVARRNVIPWRDV